MSGTPDERKKGKKRFRTQGVFSRRKGGLGQNTWERNQVRGRGEKRESVGDAVRQKKGLTDKTPSEAIHRGKKRICEMLEKSRTFLPRLKVRTLGGVFQHSIQKQEERKISRFATKPKKTGNRPQGKKSVGKNTRSRNIKKKMKRKGRSRCWGVCSKLGEEVAIGELRRTNYVQGPTGTLKESYGTGRKGPKQSEVNKSGHCTRGKRESPVDRLGKEGRGSRGRRKERHDLALPCRRYSRNPRL